MEAVVRSHLLGMRRMCAMLQLTEIECVCAMYYFHKYLSFDDRPLIDLPLIAATCIYLAGKAKENTRKLRDVISTGYATFYPEKPALRLGSTYESIRESVVSCELILLRILNFKTEMIDPITMALQIISAFEQDKWLDPFPLTEPSEYDQHDRSRSAHRSSPHDPSSLRASATTMPSPFSCSRSRSSDSSSSSHVAAVCTALISDALLSPAFPVACDLSELAAAAVCVAMLMCNAADRLPHLHTDGLGVWRGVLGCESLDSFCSLVDFLLELYISQPDSQTTTIDSHRASSVADTDTHAPSMTHSSQRRAAVEYR
eukprot:m.27423 g.27423  ORF g.27423 m.27423 type:complete len:315 (+) comp8934_c0_seq2:169-1113(+)